MDDGEAQPGEDGRQAEAEDDDEREAVADAMQMQRREQYDDRGGTRCDSAAHRGDDRAAENAAGRTPQLRASGRDECCMPVRVRVSVLPMCERSRVTATERLARADDRDGDARDQRNPRKETFRREAGQKEEQRAPSSRTAIVCANVNAPARMTACLKVARAPTSVNASSAFP